MIVHIAAYKFFDWSDLERFRTELRELCQENGLKGTILLSSEGINLFVAGRAEAVDSLMRYLAGVPGLGDLSVKRSETDRQPYSRMLVKVKREIISFGQPKIDPARYTSPRVSPDELCRWIDEGREITLLDVRNDYEVDLGTFQNAIRLKLEHFRHFPQALRDMPLSRKTPVVTFCTGGIRCEKAAPFLESLGYEAVYQLDGGILNYFAQCGSRHFEGECFVFDDRVALDERLRETGTVQCYACQAPVTQVDQGDARYVPGKSCPQCYQSQDERQRALRDTRELRIRQHVNPLPGSLPYENVRVVLVERHGEGQMLLDYLDQNFPFVGRQRWDERCAGGWIERDSVVLRGTETLHAGDRLKHRLPGTVEPSVNADIRILYEESGFVVVNKPAPLPMHPCGRYNRNTLVHILGKIYDPEKLRAAHRLDANTSGVVVLSRTARIASKLQPQFEKGLVVKRYLLRVIGDFAPEVCVCTEPIGTTLSAAGARDIESGGMAAETHFRKLQSFSDGTCLVEARPVTGRTNQIRIHAWHLGFPILGDPMYQPHRIIRDRQTLLPTEPPMCLHAAALSFLHPETRDRLTFEAELPSWCFQ
ncbi:MAG: pseudouridine synthase [Planctomycetota bacterium]|nr:pseudouridine synthase [Planctomycetota bacterium]MDA1179942.1 pseudouridine synthase [Planctomycetota bacterium]